MFLSAVGFAYAVRAVYKLPVVNGMILIATAITLFPPATAEYTLVHLYVPFGLFLVFLVTEVATDAVPFRRWNIIGLLILFALLFSPLSFAAQYAGSLKTVVLIVLLGAAASIPMPTSLFHEALPPKVRA